MNVYDVIKSLCDERGLAVTALEKELGFGRGSIGKLKKGGSTTADRLQRIGDYFGVSTEYLLTGTPSDTHIDPDMQFIMSTWKILHTVHTKLHTKKTGDRSRPKVKGENTERVTCCI